MGRISTYLQVSLDGYFAGPNGEIDWFKDTEPDPEFEEFSLERARGESDVALRPHDLRDDGRCVAVRRSARGTAGHGRRDGEESEDRVLPLVVRPSRRARAGRTSSCDATLDSDRAAQQPARLHDARQRLDRAAAHRARCSSTSTPSS